MRTLPLACLLASAAGFAPRLLPPATSQRRHKALTPMMLVEPKGADAFAELCGEGTPLAGAVSKLPPALALFGRKTATVGAAAAGVVLVPSRRPYVKAVLGATVGSAVRKYVAPSYSAATRTACLLRVSAMLRDAGDLGAVRPDEVDAVCDAWGVGDGSRELMLRQIYTRYLGALLRTPDAKTAELNELRSLRGILSLDEEAVGDAHYEAGLALFNEQIQWASAEELEDPEGIERHTLDKLLFLSDRIFADANNDESYGYDMGRVRNVFSLEKGSCESRVGAVAMPFYEKALTATLQKLDAVTPEMLVKARTTLGITDSACAELHSDCYAAEVFNCVDANDPDRKLNEADIARLAKLAGVLGLSERDAEAAAVAETAPLYEAAVRAALAASAAGDVPEGSNVERELSRCAGDIAVAAANLKIPPHVEAKVLRDACRKHLVAPFQEACQFSRVANSAGAFEATQALVAAKDAALRLLELTIGLGDDDEDDAEDDGDEVQGANLLGADAFLRAALPVSGKDRETAALYKAYLADALDQGAMDDDATASLAQLATLLHIGAFEAASAYKAIVGPRLEERLVLSAADGSYSDAEKTRNAELVASLRVPKAEVDGVALGLYERKLREVGGGGRILTPDERDSLAAMAAFFDLAKPALEPLHAQVCGAAYKQSCAEAMGSSGIITDEYKQGLEKLAVRLGLSESDAAALWGQTAVEKMKPMVEELVAEFERSVMSKEEQAAKSGKDQGEDLISGTGGELGINAGASVMVEVCNLVDFYVGNNLVTGVEGDFEYKVSADGQGMGQTAMLENLYRYFVVTAFQDKAQNKQGAERYTTAQEHFAGVLGIDPAKGKAIRNEIGATVYGNYLQNAFQQKEELDQQDFKFLVSVQEALSMSDETTQELIVRGKTAKLQQACDRIFGGSEVSTSAARELRGACAAAGLDMRAMVGDSSKLMRVFRMECQDAIETGRATVDDTDALVEAQEGFDIEPDVANAELAKLVSSRAAACLTNAVADLTQGNDARALTEVGRMLKYSALAETLGADVVVLSSVGVASKEALVRAFDAQAAGSEEVVAQVGLLRQALDVPAV